MQKHFSNRSHNFGTKLADIRNNLKEKYGSQHEIAINTSIVEIINSGKVNVQDVNKFYDEIDNKVKEKLTNINHSPIKQIKKKKQKHKNNTMMNVSFTEKPNEAIMNAKVFPAISQNNSNYIDKYAKTQRYQSFDRDRANKQVSSFKNRIMDRHKNAINPKNRIFQNRSVDESMNQGVENLRNSSFDPISSLTKLTETIKNNNGRGYTGVDSKLNTSHKNKHIDPISCPISPSPNNRELWPRTIK